MYLFGPPFIYQLAQICVQRFVDDVETSVKSMNMTIAKIVPLLHWTMLEINEEG
ncbi:hypothetical protein V7128_13120 [Neobacillus vireti]|uniref:hypothetical protein n=1 Tax=Neobacillus vireti TaxID=220686 RepID=UPI003000DAFB